MEWYGCFIVNGAHVKSLKVLDAIKRARGHCFMPPRLSIQPAESYGFIAPLGEGDKGFYNALLVATEQDVVFKTPKARANDVSFGTATS